MLVTVRYRYPLISSRTDYGAASFMVIPQEVLALLDLWRLGLLRWHQCMGCQSCPSRDARFPARSGRLRVAGLTDAGTSIRGPQNRLTLFWLSP